MARFWARVARAIETNAESLACFRVCYCAITLYFWAPYFSWIDRVPRGFFDPPVLSLANLFPTFPPAPFFMLLDDVLVVCLVFMAIGFRTRWFTSLYLFGLLVGYSFRNSFGKIDHDIIELSLPAFMLIADWGRAGSVNALLGRGATGPAAERRTEQGLALFAVVLAFGMLTAGLPKAIDWIDLDPSKSGFLGWYYPNRYSVGRAYLLSDLVPHTPLILLKAGDYFAVLLELSGFVTLLCSPRWFRIWLATATLFHFLNDLTLNIPFFAQTLSYAAFVDWSTSFRPIAAFNEALTRRTALIAVGVVAGAAALFQVVERSFLGGGSGTVLVRSAHDSYVAELYAMIPVGLGVLALLVRDAIGRDETGTVRVSPKNGVVS